MAPKHEIRPRTRRELKEREDKTVFEAQMKEVTPYRKTHPKVMELVMKSVDGAE